MKKFTGGKILQKIVIAFITIVLLFQFMMPIRSEAASLMDFELPEALDVFKYMSQIISGFGDLAMSMFNNAMLGANGFGSAMISNESLNNTQSWFVNGADGPAVDNDYNESDFEGDSNIIVGQGEDSEGKKKIVIYVKADTIEKNIIADSDVWEVPNMLYCPENIFGNNIAMLDVNFLNPNGYTSVDKDSTKAEQRSKSIAEDQLDEDRKCCFSRIKNNNKKLV